MNKVFLSLGTNLGSKKDNLKRAVKMLADLKGTVIVSESSIYETSPLYNENQDCFFNKVIEIHTRYKSKDLLEEVKTIESLMGRNLENSHNMPRIIDIDILVFGEEETSSQELVLPHPRILERKFVLEPWNEIAPDYVIYGQSLSIKELHSESLQNRFGKQRVEIVNN